MVWEWFAPAPLLLLLLSTFVLPMKLGDILKADYLPSTLMIEEAAVDSGADDYPFLNVSSDGNIREAFVTMQFHRSMMNEYLCRSFVAEEIISGLGAKGVSRLGKPAEKRWNHKPQENLLRDQGSSSYRDWLSRSVLLDDIYRHYDQVPSGDGSGPSGEYETGEVTGYAMASPGEKPNYYGPPQVSYGPPKPPPNYYPHGDTVGYEEMPGHGVEHQGGDEHYYVEDSGGKGLALKDIFDLALTALAFLAFGIFIMNLILNCLMGAQGTTVVMSTVTTTTTTAAGKLRATRSIDENLLNEIAYRVLTSMDRLVELNTAKNTKTRSCLQRNLCQNNKYSRALNGKNRIWIPVWSFGMSWLTNRLNEDSLGNLEASVLGLGNADCHKVYKSCRNHDI